MKERPILFSAPMVRAILDGRKNQTRRALNPQPDGGIQFNPCTPHGVLNGKGDTLICKFGKRGDRLWVRETWSQHPQFADIAFRADGEEFEDSDGFTWILKWKPSIHMPRWASRIMLEITNVRVERLRDIGEDDAIAEGVSLSNFPMIPIYEYKELWESLNGKGSWDLNPWVWVIEFKRIKK